MITIKSILGEGFTHVQAVKVIRAADRIAEILNTDGFKKAVLAARFTQTSDSSQKVYDTITAIKSKTFRIELNRVPNGSEIASTDTVAGITTIQIKYLDSCSETDLMNDLSHEYTHTPEGGGYTHSKWYQRFVPYLRLRPWSVPYQLGDIVEEIATKTMKEYK